jgi:protease I
MADMLKGKKVAILAADMFERVELEEPRKALEDAGADVEGRLDPRRRDQRASTTSTRRTRSRSTGRPRRCHPATTTRS